MGPPSPLRPIGDIAPGPYSVGAAPRGVPPPLQRGYGGYGPIQGLCRWSPTRGLCRQGAIPMRGTLPLRDTPSSARAGLSRREGDSIPSLATRAGYPRYNAGTAGTPTRR